MEEEFERFLVEDRVVVELKAVESLTKAHEAQLLNYLKASGKRVGLLVNFTSGNPVFHFMTPSVISVCFRG